MTFCELLKGGGRKKNLSSTIIKRTNARRDDDEADVHPLFTHPPRDPTSSKLAAVSVKLKEGNSTAAVRILCSDEVVADFSTKTSAKLQLKHPAEHNEASFPPEMPSDSALQVCEEDLLRVIRSFPVGSSGGPDGIKPQLLLEMVQSSEAGLGLLSAVTSFTNILLEEKCNTKYQNILYGGRLIALNKKYGGIRPIVVGYVW